MGCLCMCKLRSPITSLVLASSSLSFVQLPLTYLFNQSQQQLIRSLRLSVPAWTIGGNNPFPKAVRALPGLEQLQQGPAWTQFLPLTLRKYHQSPSNRWAH